MTFQFALWPWIWPCGPQGLVIFFGENCSPTSPVHYIIKLEIHYFLFARYMLSKEHRLQLLPLKPSVDKYIELSILQYSVLSSLFWLTVRFNGGNQNERNLKERSEQTKNMIPLVFFIVCTKDVGLQFSLKKIPSHVIHKVKFKVKVQTKRSLNFKLPLH